MDSIRTLTIPITANANSSKVVPFTNAYFDSKHMLVTEIIRINIHSHTANGIVALVVQRGETYDDANDSNTILRYGTASESIETVEFQYTDGLGNGLIVPENQIIIDQYGGGNPTRLTVQIQYKMRKVSNKDLYLYMVNQGAANN